MDFNYNNYPADEDSVEAPPSKAAKVTKKILRYVVYGISLIIYLALFWSIFNSCEPKEWKQKFFSEATASLEEVTYYKVQPKEFMSNVGIVYLSENYYALQSKELELGIKIKMTETKYDDIDKLVFVLRDSAGNEYPVTAINQTKKSKYLFARVCFGEVDLHIDKNYYYYIQENYDDLKGLDKEDQPSLEEHPVGTVYRLFIYERDPDGKLTLLDELVDYKYLGGKKELDESGLCIYDNKTVIIEEE